MVNSYIVGRELRFGYVCESIIPFTYASYGAPPLGGVVHLFPLPKYTLVLCRRAASIIPRRMKMKIQLNLNYLSELLLIVRELRRLLGDLSNGIRKDVHRGICLYFKINGSYHNRLASKRKYVIRTYMISEQNVLSNQTPKYQK
jgi:hypothetical protein